MRWIWNAKRKNKRNGSFSIFPWNPGHTSNSREIPATSSLIEICCWDSFPLAARPAPTGMRRLEFVASPAPVASSRNQSCAKDWVPQIPWFIQTFSLFWCIHHVSTNPLRPIGYPIRTIGSADSCQVQTMIHHSSQIIILSTWIIYQIDGSRYYTITKKAKTTNPSNCCWVHCNSLLDGW